MSIEDGLVIAFALFTILSVQILSWLPGVLFEYWQNPSDAINWVNVPSTAFLQIGSIWLLSAIMILFLLYARWSEDEP